MRGSSVVACPDSPLTPGWLYARRLQLSAPLAQSVERFHGKEKVNGSIPLGGSKIRLTSNF